MKFVVFDDRLRKRSMIHKNSCFLTKLRLSGDRRYSIFNTLGEAVRFAKSIHPLNVSYCQRCKPPKPNI